MHEPEEEESSLADFRDPNTSPIAPATAHRTTTTATIRTIRHVFLDMPQYLGEVSDDRKASCSSELGVTALG